jgi:carbamoyl-phosphate synthase large subunit
MTQCFRVLFTSAGRRVSLVRHFAGALRELGLKGKVVTADRQDLTAAAFVADAHELLPPVEDAGYVDAVKEVCRRHGINLLVPLIDPELHPLALRAAEFKALGVVPLVSSPAVNELCLDKRQTAAFFARLGIRTPEIIDPQHLLADEPARFPVFLKPAIGSSSIGATKIQSAEELSFFLGNVREPIVQEYLHGDEYTLDILADFHGRVRCVVPRLRLETRAGEISKGVTVKNRAIMAAGQHVVEALPGAAGCITVQCFLSAEGEICFTEINPRFGGGFPLSARAGADFPRWIVELVLGHDPATSIDGWEDGVVMLRYDEGMFTTSANWR